MTDLAFTKKVAKVAGKMIIDGHESMRRLKDKDNREAVTDLDRKVNTFILGEIQKAFPEDDILSEEDDPIEKGKSDRLWVVDPIDGTVNMIQGIPLYCVSIALWTDGSPQVGVVYDPIHKELFEAVKGKKSKLNGEEIHVRNRSVKDGIVLYAQSYSQKRADHGWVRVKAIREASLYDRQLGSLAIMHCYVACGRADMLVSTGGKAWDSAAGRLIVESAGGIVTNMDGETWALESRSVLAGHPKVHKEAFDLI